MNSLFKDSMFQMLVIEYYKTDIPLLAPDWDHFLFYKLKKWTMKIRPHQDSVSFRKIHRLFCLRLYSGVRVLVKLVSLTWKRVSLLRLKWKTIFVSFLYNWKTSCSLVSWGIPIFAMILCQFSFQIDPISYKVFLRQFFHIYQ